MRFTRWLFTDKKRVVRIPMFLLTITLVIGFLIINYMAMRIASPPPSDIPASALEIIKAPDKHGLKISAIQCLDGLAPVLVIEPNASHPISKKGVIVRNQLTERGTRLTDYATIKGTVVILHGRTGRKENGLGIAERFCAAGLRCILVDLPSHGESPVESVKFGNTEWEQDLAYKVLSECAQQFNFSTKNVALWGMSMGGSFAISAASDPEHGDSWSSITIVCSFDSLRNVIHRKCKFNWLTNLTSRLCEYHGGANFDKVNPAHWAKAITTPVLVVHGDQDELIPYERGKFLYESFASADKKWVTVDGGNHDNILITPMPLYAEMADWILSHFK